MLFGLIKKHKTKSQLIQENIRLMQWEEFYKNKWLEAEGETRKINIRVPLEYGVSMDESKEILAQTMFNHIKPYIIFSTDERKINGKSCIKGTIYIKK